MANRNRTDNNLYIFLFFLNFFSPRTEPVKLKRHTAQREMEATEQQDGAARPGDPAAPDAGAAHDTSDSAAAQVAEDEGKNTRHDFHTYPS